MKICKTEMRIKIVQLSNHSLATVIGTSGLSSLERLHMLMRRTVVRVMLFSVD